MHIINVNIDYKEVAKLLAGHCANQSKNDILPKSVCQGLKNLKPYKDFNKSRVFIFITKINIKKTQDSIVVVVVVLF